MVKKIRELCKEKKTSIHKLEQQLGYGNGVIGRWDKSVPSYERLSAVAAALGVSVDYLTDESKKNPAPTISEGETSETLDKLREEAEDMSEAELGLLLEKINQIKGMRITDES
jgi:transcriptional regulator with XRE-family HTH domain